MLRAPVCPLLVLLIVSACARHPSPAPDLAAAVREAVAARDFSRGRSLIEDSRTAEGVTPALVNAYSVLAAGALSAGAWDEAERDAQSACDLARLELGRRPVDQEPLLPVAIGRCIEVLAQVGVARGARSDAVAFLEQELATYRGTSIEKRIWKNLNLLNLEGTVAPPLDLSEHIGVTPPPLTAFEGKVVLLFFWAHWCADCKAQGPILAKLVEKYEPRGLVLVAPTQRFGYVAGGETAGPAVENPYIVSVQQTFYPGLTGRPMPLSEANHRRYGVSSTPTLVLVDRRGIIRLYHPGRMTEEELDPILQRFLDAAA